MGRRTLILVVALVLAALSAWAIWAFLSDVEDEARQDLEEVPAFVASEFIPRGSLGEDVVDLFIETTVVLEDLPANAIQSQEQLENTLLGSIALGPISQNQTTTTDQWGDPAGEVQGLSELIEPGFQALSIRPDEVRAVGGFIRPGDHVNLIASTEVDMSVVVAALQTEPSRRLFFPGLQEALGLTDEEMILFAETLPTQLRYTQYVIQDVPVLAVGRAAAGGPTSESTTDDGLDTAGTEIITLQVTASQAEQIVFTQEYLNTWLTLVPEGFVPEETDGVVLNDLIDLPDVFVDDLQRLGLLLSGTGSATTTTSTTTTTTTTVPAGGDTGGSG